MKQHTERMLQATSGKQGHRDYPTGLGKHRLMCRRMMAHGQTVLPGDFFKNSKRNDSENIPEWFPWNHSGGNDSLPQSNVFFFKNCAKCFLPAPKARGCDLPRTLRDYRGGMHFFRFFGFSYNKKKDCIWGDILDTLNFFRSAEGRLRYT